MTLDDLSSRTLGQLSILQSTAMLMQNPQTMLDFIARGLSELPGVENAGFRTESSNQDKQAENRAASVSFAVKCNSIHHADIILDINDPSSFEPYRPFVRNLCTSIGVILDELRQRQINEALVKELESKVIERTRELADREENLRITLNSIGDAVIATDASGCIQGINPAAEAATGWNSRDAIGKPLSDVLRIFHEETGLPAANPVERILKTGRTISMSNHVYLLAKDGEQRIIANIGAPIRDTKGEITGTVITFKDETERQRLMRIAQNSHKLESLGVLAGGIAHDFNNLLAGIFGNLDLALQSDSIGGSQESLHKALKALDRARNLSNQLLTFAKGGAPVRKLQPVSDFIRDTTDFAASGTAAVISYDIAPELWPCYFDKNQMAQVIDNIVINAIQACSNSGRITVSAVNIDTSAAPHPELEGVAFVCITITDNGPGIPKKIIDRIFDPFFTTKTKGNGLGLATSFSIVKKHKGLLEADSKPGKGASFRIYLPASQETLNEDEQPEPDVILGKGTILIMDDQKMMRDMLCRMLQKLGYDVLCAEDGEEAIEIFLSEQRFGREITAMILDLTIPGRMGGMETIGKIREMSSIPVIVASGYSDDPALADPKAYGFTAGLSKPFSRKELIGILNRLTASGD